MLYLQAGKFNVVFKSVILQDNKETRKLNIYHSFTFQVKYYIGIDIIANLELSFIIMFMYIFV